MSEDLKGQNLATRKENIFKSSPLNLATRKENIFKRAAADHLTLLRLFNFNKTILPLTTEMATLASIR